MTERRECGSLDEIVVALADLSARAKAADHRLLGYLIDIAREEAGEVARSEPELRSADIVPLRIPAPSATPAAPRR